MGHAEFVQLWNAGKLEVDVHRSKALQIAGSRILPRHYRVAYLLFSWVWILSIPVAFVVMFLYKWWLGLLILVFITPAISSSTKNSATRFMIDHALESSEFYRFAVEQGVIIIRRKL